MPEASFTSDIVMYSWIFKGLLKYIIAVDYIRTQSFGFSFCYPETVKLETDQI